MTPFYIGIGHKARHGKDTAARAIHAAYPTTTWIFGFADALKAHCRVNYGMRAKDPELLQRIGFAVRARDGEDTWINVLASAAEESGYPIILVPDVRFRNEAEWIRAQGGLLIRVRRLEADGTPFVAADRPADHPSEIDLDDWEDWDGQIVARSVTEVREQALWVFEGLAEARRLYTGPLRDAA